MLVTLILRFIHFVGLCLGKNTSGTISRTPARFSENQACTCYRVRSRLSHSHHRYPKLCSVAERFEEMFRFERNYGAASISLWPQQSRPVHPESSEHTGRLTYSKLGWILGATPLPDYSHSMVPGGLEVTSSTTRFTSLTSFVIRFEIFASRS